MIFERDVHGPVSIDVTLTDVDLIGFKNMKFTAIKGFQADLSGRTELIATIPELRLKGHYKIDGQILVLPIKGEGDMEIVISGAQSNYSFDMKPNEKKGKIHAVVEHVKFNIEPDQIKFRLDNLFNGDKTLGDNINLFLNENWRELYAETKTNLLKPSSIVMKNIINSFLDNHPYEHFFE
uniref:Protein takeout n=2 Tax=Stomoxys calcitrans TaxID=35570 RepID=A0A1I8Q556_STOCA|nr:unnamed protein product [Stomoxys calcitrans]